MKQIFSQFNDRRALTLLGGDLLVLVAFAVLGRRSHGESAGLAAAGEVFGTALPFLVAWLLTAPLFGALGRPTGNPFAHGVGRTALTWLVALPIGLLLRALMIGRWSPLSFAITTLLVNLVMLGGWRLLFVFFEQQRAKRRDPVAS